MKQIIKQSNKKTAFTIIELLTVMSIIVVLIGLLVPALNRVRIYAKGVRQRAQFHSIDAAMELFYNEFDGYPPSSARDPAASYYGCGAMKLCEAMMGWDLMGFHTNSVFRKDGYDVTGTRPLYVSTDPCSLAARKGPFLTLESADAYRMGDIYTSSTPLDPCSFVLCDVYTRTLPTGKKTGMPILYYKANTANNFIYPGGIGSLPTSYSDDAGNIYNYWDNYDLVHLGKPLDGSVHKLDDPASFYTNIKSDKITTAIRPYRADSYILLSAGYDGEYGTADDIYNFDWKYKY